MPLDDVVAFYETLTPERIPELRRLYAEDAWFKDPFNEVTGVERIERIFRHMYTQVLEPRFTVTQRLADGDQACLIWEFRFRVRLLGVERADCIRGATHLRFGPDRRVCHHRDYWDASEEMFCKWPLLGPVLNGIRRRLAV